MATVNNRKKTTDTAPEMPAEATGAVEVEQDTAATETAAEAAQVPEYTQFVYCGPTLPNGRLKEKTVLQGTFAEICAYYADVIEQYPQIKTLIVPVNRLGAFAVKVRTRGNIANKYYNDIVSAMRASKEE